MAKVFVFYANETNSYLFNCWCADGLQTVDCSSLHVLQNFRNLFFAVRQENIILQNVLQNFCNLSLDFLPLTGNPPRTTSSARVMREEGCDKRTRSWNGLVHS
jgi:hypothetical protein